MVLSLLSLPPRVPDCCIGGIFSSPKQLLGGNHNGGWGCHGIGWYWSGGDTHGKRPHGGRDRYGEDRRALRRNWRGKGWIALPKESIGRLRSTFQHFKARGDRHETHVAPHGYFLEKSVSTCKGVPLASFHIEHVRASFGAAFIQHTRPFKILQATRNPTFVAVGRKQSRVGPRTAKRRRRTIPAGRRLVHK